MKMLYVDTSNELTIDYLIDIKKPRAKALCYIEGFGWKKSIHNNREVAAYMKISSESYELLLEWED